MGKIRKDLLRDYDELSVRCKGLLRRCEAASGLLINRTSIEESRRSVDQAELVSIFTRLALLFIPLSFVAGVFEMNLSGI
jgi:Mg2+ and Co2+ transporter CorA